ncbi:MAG: thiamine/thiamine pyrophosphate ABC transporter permease [Alphaproteobacteria bacterium]
MQAVRPALLPGLVALGLLALLLVGVVGALLGAAPPTSGESLWRDAYLWRVTLFTIWQASLSAVLAVGLAIPVARALARRSAFPGRTLLLRLFGLPMVIPVIVAVLGLTAVLGRNGLVNQTLGVLGLPRGDILYGLSGILIAHVFFNMPLATRLLLQVWRAVPGETWRLASQLGMSSGQIFRLIEWPLIRQVAPGIVGLVFLLCFSSFTVVLTLGGGPKATILEVAIYQALRLDFDVARAVTLGLIQLLLCALFVAIAQRLARPAPLAPSARRPHDRPDVHTPMGRIGDAVAISLAAAVVLLPLGAVVVAGLNGPVVRVLGGLGLWQATARSVVVGFSAGLLSLGLGWCLLLTSREFRVRWWKPGWADGVEWAGSLVLVVSPLVLGAGLFVLLLPLVDVLEIGLALVVIVNAAMGLPYVVRVLGPALMRVAEQHDRLCEGLGIAGWNRLRLVEWPAVRRPAALALALTSALAMGDLGGIALFGTEHTATLPLFLYRQMASYRMGEAAVTALFLAGLCLIGFLCIERTVGGRDKR